MQLAAPHAGSRAAACRMAPRSLRRAAPRGAALQPRAAAFTSEGSKVTLDDYVTVVRATAANGSAQGSRGGSWRRLRRARRTASRR